MNCHSEIDLLRLIVLVVQNWIAASFAHRGHTNTSTPRLALTSSRLGVVRALVPCARDRTMAYESHYSYGCRRANKNKIAVAVTGFFPWKGQLELDYS